MERCTDLWMEVGMNYIVGDKITDEIPPIL